MNSQQIIDRANQVLMPTYTRFPIVLAKGEGCWVWDVEGKKYLDLVGGIAVNCLGHADPRLQKVISEQASKLVHISNLYYNLPQIELAELLVQSSFADQIFFCNSGAEANEGAIKLTRKYFKKKNLPEKYEVICMQNSFHGRTLAMISATGQSKIQKGFEPLVEGFIHVPFGDFEAIQKKINSKTAAIFLEPIQGEGGVQFPPEGYLKKVRELCDEKGLLLIYDEVQTGIGRTGTLFAYEQFGVVPDILTLAKGLAGGLPIGAILATEKVSKSFEPGDHAATFGGNPLVTRVAKEVLSILQEEVLQNCKEVGKYFLEKLLGLKKKYPVIQEIRGKGLMIGVELKKPGKDLVLRGLEKGVLLNCTQEKVLRFIPPLTLSKQEVDFAIEVLDQLFEGLKE